MHPPIFSGTGDLLTFVDQVQICMGVFEGLERRKESGGSRLHDRMFGNFRRLSTGDEGKFDAAATLSGNLDFLLSLILYL